MIPRSGFSGGFSAAKSTGPVVAYAQMRPIIVPAACPYCIEEELERTGRQITDNAAEGIVRCSRCGEEFYVAMDGVKTVMKLPGRGARRGLVAAGKKAPQ